MKNIILIVFFCGLSNTAIATYGFIHWNRTANENYVLKIDTANSYTGAKSALLYSLDVATPGVGDMFQTLKPCPIEDGVIAVSAYMKTENANRAGLSVEVYTAVDIVRYEHEEDESKGTTPWTLIKKNIDVQIDCEAINIGVYLKGGGKVWVDDFKIEVVDNTEPLSKTSYRREFLNPDKVSYPGFEYDF